MLDFITPDLEEILSQSYSNVLASAAGISPVSRGELAYNADRLGGCLPEELPVAAIIAILLRKVHFGWGIALYGSRISGTAVPASDLDVAYWGVSRDVAAAVMRGFTVKEPIVTDLCEYPGGVIGYFGVPYTPVVIAGEQPTMTDDPQVCDALYGNGATELRRLVLANQPRNRQMTDLDIPPRLAATWNARSGIRQFAALRGVRGFPPSESSEPKIPNAPYEGMTYINGCWQFNCCLDRTCGSSRGHWQSTRG